jgi:hypothetical protein
MTATYLSPYKRCDTCTRLRAIEGMLSLSPLSLSGRGSVTRHIRRTRRFNLAADAQLAVDVAAPALDPAPAHSRARVQETQGDGDGGDTWQGKERSGKSGRTNII